MSRKFKCKSKSRRPFTSQFSLEQIQGLNSRLNLIMEQTQPQTPNHHVDLYFKVIDFSAERTMQCYRPQLEQANIQAHQSRNEIARDLESLTRRRRSRQVILRGPDSERLGKTYIDRYRQIEPELNDLRNTIDTDENQVIDAVPAKGLDRYPDLAHHPKLLDYLSIRNNQKPYKSCALYRQKETPIQQLVVNTKVRKKTKQYDGLDSSLRVEDVLAKRFNRKLNKHGVKGEASNRSATSADYRNLLQEQSNILDNNTSLSKQNREKLEESLDKIVRTISATGQKSRTPTPSVRGLGSRSPAMIFSKTLTPFRKKRM